MVRSKAGSTAAVKVERRAKLPGGQIGDFMAWLDRQKIQWREQGQQDGAPVLEVFACGAWVKLERHGGSFFGPASFRPVVSRFIRERMDSGSAAAAPAAVHSEAAPELGQRPASVRRCDLPVWDDFAVESPLRLADMPGATLAERVAELARCNALYADQMLAHRRQRCQEAEA